MTHPCLLAFAFELIVLCACASLCASAVVIPTGVSPTQDLPATWRRMSDVAAAAATAATEEVCPGPSPETVQVIRIAARAATAATATAIRAEALETSASSYCPPPSVNAIAEAAHTKGVGGPYERGRWGVVARGQGGGRRWRGGGGPAAGAVRGGIDRPGSREWRKPRTSIPLGDKIALVNIKDAGHTWPETLDMFRLDISVSAARNIYRNRDKYKGRAAASDDLSATRLRRSYFESISQALWAWYKTLQRVGGRHLPVSGGLLEAWARRIATELGVTGFKGSPHFIQNWAARHDLRNVAL